MPATTGVLVAPNCIACLCCSSLALVGDVAGIATQTHQEFCYGRHPVLVQVVGIISSTDRTILVSDCLDCRTTVGIFRVRLVGNVIIPDVRCNGVDAVCPAREFRAVASVTEMS